MKIINHDEFRAQLVSHVALEKNIATISIIHPNSTEILVEKTFKCKTYDEALVFASELKKTLTHIKTDIQKPTNKKGQRGTNKQK